MSDRNPTVELLFGLAEVLRRLDLRWYLFSAEDLVATKILSGRPKDVEDVAGILHDRGARLDLARIRVTLGLIEQALGQSDLTPVLEAQLAKLQI